MPNKTAEFSRNPKLFLQSYWFRNLSVPFGTGGVSPDPIRVSIESSNGDGSWSPVRSDAADAIAAYCLPYARGVVTKLQLGNAADFFFTSELNGCTFVIANAPGHQGPLVAHFAGDLGRDIGSDTEAPLREPMHSAPFTTLRPKASLGAALNPAAREFAPTWQGSLDAAARKPAADIERDLAPVRRAFGPPEYYDRLSRYSGLEHIVDFNIVGWRKPDKGWRFYAQASGRGTTGRVSEIRVSTKETRLADGRTGNPAYVTTLWKGEPPTGSSAWRRG